MHSGFWAAPEVFTSHRFSSKLPSRIPSTNVPVEASACQCMSACVCVCVWEEECSHLRMALHSSVLVALLRHTDTLRSVPLGGATHRSSHSGPTIHTFPAPVHSAHVVASSCAFPVLHTSSSSSSSSNGTASVPLTVHQRKRISPSQVLILH